MGPGRSKNRRIGRRSADTIAAASTAASAGRLGKAEEGGGNPHGPSQLTVGAWEVPDQTPTATMLENLGQHARQCLRRAEESAERAKLLAHQKLAMPSSEQSPARHGGYAVAWIAQRGRGVTPHHVAVALSRHVADALSGDRIERSKQQRLPRPQHRQNRPHSYSTAQRAAGH
jgi:hypothetical protein